MLRILGGAVKKNESMSSKVRAEENEEKVLYVTENVFPSSCSVMQANMFYLMSENLIILSCLVIFLSLTGWEKICYNSS